MAVMAQRKDDEHQSSRCQHLREQVRSRDPVMRRNRDEMLAKHGVGRDRSE